MSFVSKRVSRRLSAFLYRGGARSAHTPDAVVIGSGKASSLEVEALEDAASVGTPSTAATPVVALTIGTEVNSTDDASLGGEVASSCSAEDLLEDGELLSRAANSFQFVAAYRALLRLESAGSDPLNHVDATTLDRIRRLGGRHGEFEQLLSMSLNDATVSDKNSNLGLEWGVQLVDGMMRLVSYIDFDFDIVRGLAGRAEKDLESKFDPNIISVTCLGEQHPADVVNRKILYNRTIGSKSDDIFYQSICDSLNEPLGSIMVMTYTPPAGASEVAGEAVPAPIDGYSRNDYIICATKLTPRATGGYRETCVAELKLSPFLFKLVSMVPNFVLKRALRGWFENGVRDFQKHVETCPEIGERIASSLRSDLYHQLQRRVHDHHSTIS